MRWILPAAAAVLVSTSLGLAGYRVAALEASEVGHGSEWIRLEAPADGEMGRLEIARVDLRQGALATFEVCALDQLEPERWSGTVDLAVRHLDSGAAVVEMPLEAPVLAYATRGSGGACLLLAFDEPITARGVHVVEARWQGPEVPEAVAGVPLRARIMAHAPLSGGDRLIVTLVIAGSLLGLLGVVRWRRASWSDAADELEGPSTPLPMEGPPALSRPLARAAVGVVALVAVALAAGFLPLSGAFGGLVSGLAVAAMQVLLAVALVQGAKAAAGGRASSLAMVRPTRAAWLLLVAPLLGAGLWALGLVLGDLVPSTSVAPIQTFVSSPGGMLAVAATAAIVPIAEELFFRGLLFGVIEQRFGGSAAFAVVVLLFSLAHLAQAWGAWGSVAAIVVTGVVLTALRFWTRSVVVPAIAHLAHNGIIVYITVSAAAGQ